MKPKNDLPAERARELLAYDEGTGLLTWKVDMPRIKRAGKTAGWLGSLGYFHIKIDRRVYQAHRLAWVVATGNWPKGEIDHVNGVKTDNRFCNLRDVTRAVNAQNIRSARVDSASGVLGVSLNRASGKWVAMLSVDRRATYLGSFGSMEEASAAYIEGKRNLHNGCTI